MQESVRCCDGVAAMLNGPSHFKPLVESGKPRRRSLECSERAEESSREVRVGEREMKTAGMNEGGKERQSIC